MFSFSDSISNVVFLALMRTLSFAKTQFLLVVLVCDDTATFEVGGAVAVVVVVAAVVVVAT